MRYAQGGGLAAESRSRREQVRMQAVKMFEQRAPAAKIAAELRVTEQSVRRWRQAWKAGGPAGPGSEGPGGRCRLGEEPLGEGGRGGGHRRGRRHGAGWMRRSWRS